MSSIRERMPVFVKKELEKLKKFLAFLNEKGELDGKKIRESLEAATGYPLVIKDKLELRGAVTLSNTPSGEVLKFVDEILFQARVIFNILPEKKIDQIIPASTTPNIYNLERFTTSNTGVVNITNFLNGQPGQTIKILGDGFSTLVFGTNLKTNTGVDKLMLVNRVYTLTFFNNVWVEDT